MNKLAGLPHDAGFAGVSWYGDVCGGECAADGETLCAVSIK